MGSEDVEVQCQTQSASASVPCESTASYGIATVPFVASMSVAPNQAGTPTPVSANTTMLAQSASSHTPPQNVAVQPSVAASPLPHVQVIQQPLQNQYLQHYIPQQQHMFLPGNLTIQPTLQSIGAPGISLQLQGKTMDNKTATPTIISAAPMQSVGNFSAQNIIPTAGQMTASAKACVQGQMLATTSKSTAVIQGQSGFIPTTSANQTVVIGQLGVLSNQPSVIPHQAKAIAESQKGKSFLISQPATLHPKSPILPSPNVSCAGQMIATSQLKQIPSAPHIISTQAPTMIASQAQILGSLQALGASLPQSITWAATPGNLHSPALFGQNPIFIRSQQSDMFIQSPPQQTTIHAVPVAAAPQPPQQQTQPQQQQAQQQQTQQQPQPQPPQPPPPNTPAPQPPKLKVRPASSVATQTIVSTSAATSTNATITKTQGKLRTRLIQCRSSPAPSGGSAVAHLQTATTQTQTQPPSSQKADAANQTKPEAKISSTSNKILEINTKSSATETSFASSARIQEPIEAEIVPHIEKEKPNVPALDIAIVAPSPVLPLKEEAIQMDIVEETVINSVQIPIEKVIPNRKEIEAENIGIVAPMPEVNVKEKQPQKAIVKPHVLTHVIEGFVIQEGSEPFPVNLPSYSTPVRETIIEKPIESANVSQNSGEEEIRRHKKKASSKKIGKSKKKKLGLKSKKGWKKNENRIYEVQEWNQQSEMPSQEESEMLPPVPEQSEELQSVVVETDLTEMQSIGESVPSSPQDIDTLDEDRPSDSGMEFEQKSPLKWTVKDVVDFVRHLPGCSDYADEFRAQEIDGQALMLLKEDHLMSLMSMKLGPALKVCARINSIRGEVNH